MTRTFAEMGRGREGGWSPGEPGGGHRPVSGFVVAAIAIFNLRILVGLEDGYAPSPAEVFQWSVLLGMVDLALLAAGPVLGSMPRCGFAVGTAEASPGDTTLLLT